MTTAHPDHHDGGREASARPTPKEVLASILKRAVLPALVAFGVLVAIGKIIMNVFDEIPAEEMQRDGADPVADAARKKERASAGLAAIEALFD